MAKIRAPRATPEDIWGHKADMEVPVEDAEDKEKARAAEALEEFKDAVLEGEAIFPSMEEEDLVLSDGHASIFFADNSMLGEGLFGLTVVDGGGFTGVFMTKESWEEMKREVDERIAKRTPGH